jgi:type I restriction enzyme, S subunit
MRDGWSEQTIGEIVTIVNGGTPSTKIENYWGGEIVWITTTELTAFDGKRVNSSKRTITHDGLNSGPAKMVRAGTTLVGTTATIGTCAMAACDLTFNQQISGLLSKTNKLDDGFLFYWIQFAKPIFEGLAAGTSFKRISTSVLKTVQIKFPPLPEQKRIVDLISSVDSYIQSLQQQSESAKRSRNAVLHELLTTGGDGWVESSLGLQMSLEYGKPLTESNRDGVGFPVYGSAGIVGMHSEPLLSTAPVIIVGRKGTAGAVYWSEDQCFVIDTAFFVAVKTDIELKFLFHLLNFVDLKSVTAQTGVPGLNRDRAYSLKCKIPPKSKQLEIVEIISTMDEIVNKTESILANTQNLRSGLLSDLLSGEHEIPASYDKVIGAA